MVSEHVLGDGAPVEPPHCATPPLPPHISAGSVANYVYTQILLIVISGFPIIHLFKSHTCVVNEVSSKFKVKNRIDCSQHSFRQLAAKTFSQHDTVYGI